MAHELHDEAVALLGDVGCEGKDVHDVVVVELRLHGGLVLERRNVRLGEHAGE